jgi:hypothetical protein
MDNEKFCSDLTEYLGAPKNWKMLTDDKLKSNLSQINSNYSFGRGYKDNCVNCVMAYELRQRGYDVVAKSTQECNVSRKALEMWYGAKETMADSLKDVIDTVDINVNARYFLGVKYPKGGGHAMAMVVSDGVMTIIDAQIGCAYNVKDLSTSSVYRFSYFRIDNLEVTQTGYNACKGGSEYDV